MKEYPVEGSNALYERLCSAAMATGRSWHQSSPRAATMAQNAITQVITGKLSAYLEEHPLQDDQGRNIGFRLQCRLTPGTHATYVFTVSALGTMSDSTRDRLDTHLEAAAIGYVKSEEFAKAVKSAGNRLVHKI